MLTNKKFPNSVWVFFTCKLRPDFFLIIHMIAMAEVAWNLFAKFAFFKKKIGGERLAAKEVIRTLFSIRNKEISSHRKFHKLSVDLFAKSALGNPREGLGVTVCDNPR